MIRTVLKLNLLGSLVALLAMTQANPATAQVVYGVTGVGGAASTLYTETYSSQPSGTSFTSVGSVTLGPSGPALSLASLTYANGVLYGVTNSMGGTVNGGGTFANSLVTINASTGVASLVAGNLGTGAQVQSLAYSSENNTLYGFSKAGVGSSPDANSVVTISTSTGLASFCSARERASRRRLQEMGLAVDSAGNIYLSPFTITGAAPNTMYSVDPVTGAAIAGFPFTNIPLIGSNMKALAFDGSGNFYGLNFQPNTTTDLVSLSNIGSSWQLENLGTTTGGPYVGIAFAPVPEPGSVVLVGLVFAVFGACGWMRRRQAKLAGATSGPLQA